VVVKWFFIAGGVLFLLAGLFLKERPTSAMHEAWLAFTLMGVFWAGTQLLIMAAQRWKQ
jgi:hypothetical protein